MTTQAKIFSGVSRELSRQVREEFTPSAQRRQKEEREERRLRAARRESELADIQQQNELREAEGEVTAQQIEIMRQQNNQAMASNARQTAYSAFDRYTSDYDPRHLNTMLKDLRKNPMGKRLFGDVTRVDPVTENDAAMLQRMGLDPQLVLENPELRNEVVIATRADGTKTVEDLSEVFKMTGYTQYASDRELARQRKVAEVMSMYRTNGLKTETERAAHRMVVAEGYEPGTDEYNQRYNEAYKELTQDEQTFAGTQDEREAERRVLAEGYQKGTDEYRERYNEVYSQIKSRERQTSKSRDLDEAEQAKEVINEKVQSMEGTESFFDLDFTKRENRLKFENEVRRIERLADSELSAQDKKDLSYIKQLIAVADPTSDITEDETGIIDRFSRGVRNYLTDNVSGLDSTSAYSAYRNIIRNALYGSALTDAEIKAFNQQFGNLGQQTGPVLAQFRTALQQVRAKLESLYATNDSYVTHFRMGVDQEELGQIIDSIDERLEFFRRAEGEIPQETRQDEPPSRANNEPALTDEDIQQLDSIFQPGGDQ